MTGALQGGGWIIEQALVLREQPVPGWLGPAVGGLNALLVAVPAVLLALIPRSTVVNLTGRLWAASAALLAVLACARAVPIQHNALYLVVLAVLGGVAGSRVGSRGVAGSRVGIALVAALALPRRQGGRMSPWAVAAGVGALVPWLWLAALGGLLETLAAAGAAAALGRLAARLLPAVAGSAAFTGSRWRSVGLGGLVSAVCLTLLAGGTGASGVPLLALLSLPALAFPAAALARSPRSVAVLIGLATFGPLAFVEPAQTALFLGLDDVGKWALLAALSTLTLALLSGIVLLLPRGSRPAGSQLASDGPELAEESPASDRPERINIGSRRSGGRSWAASRWSAGWVTAVVVATGALVGYGALGRPGLYGDELFVVLRTQAGLTNLPADLPARRAAAYRQLVDTADRTQGPLRRELSRLHVAYTPFYLVNGLEVAGGPAVRAWLSTRPEVDRVLLNPRLRPIPERPGPITGHATVDDRPQWNVAMLGADRVWASGDTGQGITVGGSDSGIDGTHPALASGFRGGEDSWYDPWNGTRTPTDDGGHGTHTLGSAVGSHGIGVAPGARWMGCVNLARDLGSPAGYLRCLQFMLAPFPYGGDPLRDGRPERAADVLTNSWGCTAIEGCDAGSLRPAIDALSTAGIFVVVAAGNTGPGCGTVTDPPARYGGALSVGAVDSSGQVAAFSSRGGPESPKPELLAPGVNVLSALPNNGYAALSGTSMAAPHVAGVVALMWSANPHLAGDVARTRQLLVQTATPASGATACEPDARIVNADAAVQAARNG